MLRPRHGLRAEPLGERDARRWVRKLNEYRFRGEKPSRYAVSAKQPAQPARGAADQRAMNRGCRNRRACPDRKGVPILMKVTAHSH